MQLPGWGTAVGAIVNKVTSWIPNPKQSKENAIDKLVRQNAELQKQTPISVYNANLIELNAYRIKQLRKELERID